MSFTVIFPSGKVQCFYVRAVAELYASLNGGFLVTPEVLSGDSLQNTPTVGRVTQK